MASVLNHCSGNTAQSPSRRYPTIAELSIFGRCAPEARIKTSHLLKRLRRHSEIVRREKTERTPMSKKVFADIVDQSLARGRVRVSRQIVHGQATQNLVSTLSYPPNPPPPLRPRIPIILKKHQQ